MAEPTMSRRLVCMCVPLLMFQSSIILSCSGLLPMLPLLGVPQAWARRLFCRGASAVEAAWLGMAVTLLRYGLGVRIVFHVEGAASPADLVGAEDAVIISNHRTRLDWMFLWALGGALGRFGGLKIVLKDSLQHIPGFGWAAQCFGFAFMRRGDKNADLATQQGNRDADLATLRNTMALHGGTGSAILIFPEGTDLSDSNKEKDRAYVAERAGLEIYEHVLHPKTAGFVEIWTKAIAVAREGAPPTLLDVTLCYVDYAPGERPCEKSVFWKGRPCREVHIFLRKVEKPPTSAQESAELIKMLWAEKDAKLRRAYENVSASGRPKFSALASSSAATVEVEDLGATLLGSGATLEVEASTAGAGMLLGSGTTLLMELLALGLCWRLGPGRGLLLLLGACGAFAGASAATGGLDRTLLRHLAKNP